MECANQWNVRTNGTVPFGNEPFHRSNVNANGFQMVLQVSTMEEECVLNHRNPVFKQTKESSFIFIAVRFWLLPFSSVFLHWDQTERSLKPFCQQSQKNTDSVPN